MSDSTAPHSLDCKRTKSALFFLHILSEPLVAFYSLLPFILIHDLNASPFQLTIFISLRPILSVLSPYWGAFCNRNTKHLLLNVKLACILAYLPFLIFSHTSNVWLIILAATFFQLFHRAGVPAWLEIIQRRVSKKSRERTFSLSFTMGFVVSGVFGITLGLLLDKNNEYLKILMLLASLMGMSSLFFLNMIPISGDTQDHRDFKGKIRPLKESFTILKSRSDVRYFQIVFMIGGATLMLMAPSLSIYYVKVLSLTYLDISMARFVFMAIGVMCSMYSWKQVFQRRHINELLGPILIGFTIFPCLLLFAQLHLFFLYFAFFIYGIAQAGSHLVWNLSPLSFSKNSNSIHYTQTNLFLIGMRGLIFPFLGSVLCNNIGAPMVLVLGIGLCFLGIYYAYSPMKLRRRSHV